MEPSAIPFTIPTGTPWLLGYVASMLGGIFLFFRQYLSRDAANRADDSGRVSAINVYKELLEAERAARAEADKRADGFARERNEAVSSLGEMRGQLAAMTHQLEALQAEVQQLRKQIDAKP